MKECTECKKKKGIIYFRKHKNGKDGLNSKCIICINAKTKEYSRTKYGLVNKIYGGQKCSSKKRGHENPKYTNKELLEWCFSQKLFHNLYYNRKESGYQKMLNPSCDRLDDSQGYSLDNIQLMTWEENNNKAYRDIRSGKIIHGNKPQKAVLQINIDTGMVINEFISLSEAQRKTGIILGNISNCCAGKRKSAGGFEWRDCFES